MTPVGLSPGHDPQYWYVQTEGYSVVVIPVSFASAGRYLSN